MYVLGCGGVGDVGGVGGVGGVGVWIICVDNRSRYMCIMLGGYLHTEVHPVLNSTAPYVYMLPNMYLFIADITNPDSFV